jgi:hypothetical protein
MKGMYCVKLQKLRAFLNLRSHRYGTYRQDKVSYQIPVSYQPNGRLAGSLSREMTNARWCIAAVCGGGRAGEGRGGQGEGSTRGECEVSKTGMRSSASKGRRPLGEYKLQPPVQIIHQNKLSFTLSTLNDRYIREGLHDAPIYCVI